MGLFKSREEENEEAYQRGVQAGKQADAIDGFLNIIGDVVASSLPLPERTVELNEIERKGFEWARSHDWEHDISKDGREESGSWDSDYAPTLSLSPSIAAVIHTYLLATVGGLLGLLAGFAGANFFWPAYFISVGRMGADLGIDPNTSPYLLVVLISFAGALMGAFCGAICHNYQLPIRSKLVAMLPVTGFALTAAVLITLRLVTQALTSPPQATQIGDKIYLWSIPNRWSEPIDMLPEHKVHGIFEGKVLAEVSKTDGTVVVYSFGSGQVPDLGLGIHRLRLMSSEKTGSPLVTIYMPLRTPN